MLFSISLNWDDNSSSILGEIDADSWQDAGRKLNLSCINDENLRDDCGFFVLPGIQPKGVEYIAIIPLHPICSLRDLVKEIMDVTNDHSWLEKFNSQFN